VLGAVYKNRPHNVSARRERREREREGERGREGEKDREGEREHARPIGLNIIYMYTRFSTVYMLL
jgi:hypothetical protein